MLQRCKRVLVISPHTDDAEWGCGGTIAKLVDSGVEVGVMVFSPASDTLPKGFVAADRIIENEKSARFLGLRPIHASGAINRRFHERRQVILDDLVRAWKTYHPDLVIGPSLSDTHQDHEIVAKEMVRAFKSHCSILGYEIPWNDLTFSPTCLVEISIDNLAKKIAALKLYDSCKSAWHFNEMPEVINATARVRGLQARVRYAEGFEVIRWVVR